MREVADGPAGRVPGEDAPPLPEWAAAARQLFGTSMLELDAVQAAPADLLVRFAPDRGFHAAVVLSCGPVRRGGVRLLRLRTDTGDVLAYPSARVFVSRALQSPATDLPG